MRQGRIVNGGEGGREWATWTQASLYTVGNSLKSAGSSLVTGIKASYDHMTSDHTEKERMLDVKFGHLELLRGEEERRCPVLVLIYEVGFQVGLYSLQRHSFVHTISVPGCILKIACSPRVLLVAMAAQIMAYDICTFEVQFSTVTYPSPTRALGSKDSVNTCVVPLALGSRWLAHASNQAVQTASGIAVSHHLGTAASPAARGSHLETVQQYAGHAAKTGGRQLKTLGEASYKYLASQVDSWRNSSASVPTSPSSSCGSREDPDVVGTVVVRDVVSRRTIAHFRAHTSPLSLLQFDPSGTLLVTTSVHGHTINIFHISSAKGTTERGSSVTHLYKLSRGMTPALIQAVAFSADGNWLCASSARGTSHIFHLGSQMSENDMPPHLRALNHAKSERDALRAVKLSAIGRARSASLLNGSIPGTSVANAAVGLYNGSPGSYLVASLFAPRHDDMDLESSSGLEDLWVASNDGQLFRHHLSLQAPSPVASGTINGPTDKIERAEPEEGICKELVVEAAERFDVWRRYSWPEREERLFDSNDSSPSASAHLPGQPAWANFAETSISGQNANPLWADPQFHILEMQTSVARNESSETSDRKSISQAFKDEELLIPTKRIDVQDREILAPVIIEGAETAVLRGVQMRVDTHFPKQ